MLISNGRLVPGSKRWVGGWGKDGAWAKQRVRLWRKYRLDQDSKETWPGPDVLQARVDQLVGLANSLVMD